MSSYLDRATSLLDRAILCAVRVNSHLVRAGFMLGSSNFSPSAHATHNHLVINLMASVSDIISETIRETRKVLLYSEHHPEELYAEHELIFKVIKNKDSAKAAHGYMYDHLVRVNHDLFTHIDLIE